jgi:hypothetical protein
VPDDLLRHVGGPTPYSSAWWWIGGSCVAVLAAWYVGVFLVTSPTVREAVARRRSIKRVRGIGDRFRSGELGREPAGAALGHVVRRFLSEVTGVRAEYMQVDDIADGELASAAPLLAEVTDAQFNPDSRVEMTEAIARAEELIRSWP